MVWGERYNEHQVIGSRLLTPAENAQALRGLNGFGVPALSGLRGLGDAAQGQKVSAGIAAGASAVAAGAAATSNPVGLVVALIASIIAIVAGFISKIFGKKAQREAEMDAIRAQIEEIKKAISQVDAQRASVRKQMVDVQNKLLVLGYTDLVAKTPIPADQPEQVAGLGNAKERLADAKSDYKVWQARLELKGKNLEADQATLQGWYDYLTGAAKRDQNILYVGVGALAVTMLLVVTAKK